jgi:hypothetical protein
MWINQTGYSGCFNLGLSGSLMQYYNGKVYLFSGKNVNRSEITYFNGVCEYELKGDLGPSEWRALDTNKNLFNSSRGGSCVHDGFLYTFFGFNVINEVPVDLSTIARLNLSNIEAGWTELESSGCPLSILARDSFGFYYSDSSIYINGGLLQGSIKNSIIKIALNNSESVLECSELFENTVWPGRRNGATMVYIAGGLYLFGGQENGVIFSDFYVFNLTTFTWTKLVTYGDTPTARYKHSAISEGKYMIISGGIGLENQLLSDYYLYETETFTWTKIKAESGSIIPPPVYSNCLTVNFPKLYAVGGFEDTHITNSLWEFDLATGQFQRLYEFNSKTDIGFFGHGCAIEKDAFNNLIISAYLGSTSINYIPYCAITQYNLSESQIKPKVYSLLESNFPCRVENSFNIISDQFVLIAGGQRYEEEFFNDLWVIDRISFKAYELADIIEPVYSTAFTFINNSLLMFSGFGTNGLASFSPSIDLATSIGLTSIENKVPGLVLGCGEGMELVDGKCQFCQFGYYNPSSERPNCIKCPPGTYNQGIGSTSVYQCIPCPYSTYSLGAAVNCLPCPKDRTCYIGTSTASLTESNAQKVHDFRHHKEQPKLYEPPNVFEFRGYLWLTTLCIFAVFTIVFILDYRVRIFLSYNDIFKNMHIEMMADEHGNSIQRSKVIEPNMQGGYFSVVTVLLLLAISVDAIYTYVKTNERETIVLVPIDTLIDKEDFDDNSIRATLMFSSYRGECSFNYLNFTHSDKLKIESKSVDHSEPFCTYNYHLKATDIIETNDFIQFYFNDSEAYTSDINIRLKTDSSIPDKDSIVTQYLTANEGEVFRGISYSQFTFSFLPSFYKESELFHEVTHKGYVLSVPQAPLRGSQTEPRELGILSGLGIKVNFNQIEIGISTFKGPEKEPTDFIFEYAADFPATIVMFGFMLWTYEFFFYLFKGKTSGRRKLIKRHIEREKARRDGYDSSLDSEQ